MTLTEFLLARIAEDEAVARAVPPLDHNYDMGGNRQDERFVFDRTLPSSADGMGNWSKHRGPETKVHFSRHNPARVLAECEAKRRIVEQATNAHFMASQHDSTLGDKFIWRHAEGTLMLLALPYAEHEDYREDWRP